jgi:AbrB family looped-hinge helix DNA binding protein
VTSKPDIVAHVMKTVVDCAGRIVVPKALRQALSLKPGQLLDIRTRDGRLEVEIRPPALQRKRDKWLGAVPTTRRRLTAEQVRNTLEGVRR